MFNKEKRFKSIVLKVLCALVLSAGTKVYGNGLSDSIPLKVLILGNSITWHGAKPTVGWSGNWGMAASAVSKDFLHLLKSRIYGLSPQTEFQFANIADSFERKFWKYNAADFKKFSDWQPDLIVLEIGENINDTLAVKYELGKHLAHFSAELSEGKPVKICLVGSFWPNQYIDQIMRSTALQNNWMYVDLQGLYKDRNENTAIQQYQNQGVGMHPSDAGMEHIANRIWNEIQHLFK
ncbi:SGNH/GDSL hydrolase family protein [Pedobacter sp. N36a]|uniref:SGNH/GDSL hydrolase family protein n=1 Tax=Pedobacter sp. N36a TaxID=2767996 RepID=UPI0016569E21|nr:SGNH/GDSL hydrolase family protein [Pedobacter sp. N36a]MBC8986056.1 SGNH/GDSL hydrolase family protein [Pedobacter sp. N36a]